MTTVRPTPEEAAELDALFDLALREHRAGRLAEAAAAYRRILALRPDIAEVCNNLGNVLVHQGRLDEAAAQFERAVALKPGLYQAVNSLGDILQQQGKLDQAVARFEQVLALRPDLAEVHYNLGNTLLSQGQLDKAAAHYQQAVALKPNLAEAHNNLGNILRMQGQLDQAAVRYRRAAALNPDLAEAHNNLGNVLKDQGTLDEATAYFERAAALKPDSAEVRYNLGNALLGQGKFDEATAEFERAAALKPDFADPHNSLGSMLKDQGKFDQAAAYFEQAIALAPDYAEPHYNRADLKTFRAGDADLAALEALAADTSRLPLSKMLYVHFALGKALEDVGDYHRAFEQWLLANALRRREVNYDEAASQQFFRRIAQVFDSRLMNRFAAVGDPSPVPIFVLGMPRSGSTLVEQILASHPQVHAGGELTNLDRLAEIATAVSGQRIPFPQYISTLDADSLRRLGQAYLESLPTLEGDKTRITDKRPGNYTYVGLIRLILPNARIIHTVRNPVDTCVSCFSRYFTQGQPFSYDLAELGRYYRWYDELMAHWRSVLPAGAMLDVSYEDVVDNLEQQARRLIEFCGLPWDARCLSFHETSRSVRTASNVQVRRPLYRGSVERWRRYEAYLQPLLAELDLGRQPG